MELAAETHLEIERVARAIEAVIQARAATCVQAVDETAGIIKEHLQMWKEGLRQQLERELAELYVGCPPSFIRVAGQSHLEKPFNRLLAWLANPDQDHGCGTAFLQGLAQQIKFPELMEDLEQIASGSGGLIDIRAEEILDGDDSGKQPDLIIRTAHAALLLENKVYAPESGDQYSPYLAAFHTWAGQSRGTRSVLCARSKRPVPDGWDEFLQHSDLADILLKMSRRTPGLPIWGRICAEMCAAALNETSNHEKVRLARKVLDETRKSPVTVEQIDRLRDLLPLPQPITPWRDIAYD
jgi:hypothetical protein